MKVLLIANYKGDRQWSMDRYCRMLARALRDESIDVKILRPPVILGRLCPARPVNKWIGYLDKFLLFPLILPSALKNLDLIHILDQGNALYSHLLSFIGLMSPMRPMGPIITCHDLLAIRASLGEFPQHQVSLSGRLFQRLILRALRKSPAIISVSESTRNDAARLIGNSVVIPNAIEEFWRPIPPADAWPLIERAGVCAATRRTGCLLHVGGDQWYKNRAAVIRAFIGLRRQTIHSHKLIMVGPKSNFPELHQSDLAQDVIFLSDIPDQTLRALYSVARALIFPSIAEGFGWPILEAQSCGCPVIASESVRQVAGPAAIYPPESDWPAAIANLLEMDQSHRLALIEAALNHAHLYNIKTMSRQYAEYYHRIINPSPPDRCV
ncbi:MAG: glycosyltransferase family 1 protein [Chthoniobacteraceae bacterium]|jgi:glycosyltransferase involved in cell wall biosynthesis